MCVFVSWLVGWLLLQQDMFVGWLLNVAPMCGVYRRDGSALITEHVLTVCGRGEVIIIIIIMSVFLERFSM